jgi:hypothetical protein
MAKVSPIDYKRVSSLPWQTIRVQVPEELVVPKGNSSLARKRCRAAEARLRETVRGELRAAGRRRFRGHVAIHLELSGVSLSQSDHARRTVKATLDNLQGALYVDDREVALLDVAFRSGPLEARIGACSQGRYTDAFDILGGASRHRQEGFDYDEQRDDFFGLDPWAWSWDSIGGDHELEVAEEHLADWQSRVLPGEDNELRARMIEFNRSEMREMRLARLLSQPFLPTDRPGEQTVQGRLSFDHSAFPRPTQIYLPAPAAGRAGSWTDIASEAVANHFARWPGISEILAGEPVMLDIAVGRDGWECFDIDNLAHRVIEALRAATPQLGAPGSYRAYRCHGVDDSVVVTLHSEKRADRLRDLLNGGWSAAMDLLPDREGPVYRRRPSVDDKMYEEIRSLAVEPTPAHGVAPGGSLG